MNDMSKTDAVQIYLDLAIALRKWEPEINEALARAKGSHTFQNIVQMVMNGSMAMFTYPDAFMIMELLTYPQFKVWHCFLAGGNHDTIVGTEDQMVEIARNHGCKYMGFSGRRGWDRDAKKRDWDFVCTTMYKSVEGRLQ